MLTLLFLKATIVVGITGMTVALFHRASASVRHGIWATGLAVLLALPFLSYSVPTWTVSSTSSVAALASGGRATKQRSRMGPTAVEPAVERAIQELSPFGPLRPRISAHDVVVPVRPWYLQNDVRVGIVVLWSAGALLILGRFFVRVGRLARLIKRSRPADPGIQTMLGEACRTVGLRRTPRCHLSSTVRVPVTWGMFKPVLLLPEAALAWSVDRTQSVLLHELSHIRRWDWFGHVLGEVTCAVYWPNLLVWHATRAARAEQEQACDDAVLRYGLRGSEYATHLFDIACSAVETRLVSGGLAFAGRSALRRRVMAILSPTPRRGALSAWTVGGLMVGALTLGVPVAGWEASSGGRYAVLEYDLIDSLVTGPARARVDAARSLGALGSRRAVPVLLQALTDPSQRVRESAATSLEQIGDGHVVSQILDGLDATSIVTRGGAIRAVRSLMGSDAIVGGSARRHRLVQALAHRARYDDVAEVRALAVRYLAGLCDNVAVETILLTLNDLDSEVQAEALNAARGSMHLDDRLRIAVEERAEDCGPHGDAQAPMSPQSLSVA